MANNLKFFWNGIKANGGKLQRAFYSDGALLNSPAGTITIYGRDYKSFSGEVREAFTVENDSEMQTDYFEQDRIRVTPTHPLYAEVIAAMQANKAHYARPKRTVARANRCADCGEEGELTGHMTCQYPGMSEGR